MANYAYIFSNLLNMVTFTNYTMIRLCIIMFLLSPNIWSYTMTQGEIYQGFTKKVDPNTRC